LALALALALALVLVLVLVLALALALAVAGPGVARWSGPVRDPVSGRRFLHRRDTDVIPM